MVQLKLREYRHARRLLLAGNSIEAVAAELGGRFTTEELAKQMEKVRAHRAKLDRKRAEQRLEERRNTRPYREQATLSDKYKIPQRVLEDRERRQNAPDTLNSRLLGDPATPRWMSNADRPSGRRSYGMGT